MLKKLQRKSSTIFHFVDGKRIEGAPPDVCGNLSGVSGDLSGVRGNLSGVSGDLTDVSGSLSGVSGNLSGVSGNLSGVSGDLDECKISDDDREKGIDIEDLIEAINSPEVGK